MWHWRGEKGSGDLDYPLDVLEKLTSNFNPLHNNWHYNLGYQKKPETLVEMVVSIKWP